MTRAFNVDARVSSFELPALTKRQIKALMSDLDQDARSVIIIAIAELYGREVENERDVFAELDAIKAKLGMSNEAR